MSVAPPIKAQDAEVLILGAGMAGLAAARTLAEAGMRVLVLEAREHVGGRIRSHTTPEGIAVELGAEFVHGHVAELDALIAQAGVRTVERDGSMLRAGEHGGLVEDPESEHGDPFQQLENLADLPEDLSFHDWLRSSNVPEDAQQSLLGYVEGFNAADAQRISAQSLGIQQRAEAASGGGQSSHVRGGYAQLPEFLAQQVRAHGGEIRFSCEVTAVRWQAGAVEVELHSGDRLRAPHCVVTLPLGVLQLPPAQGGVRFDPEPAALMHAHRLAMGEAAHFTMIFREPVWERAAPQPSSPTLADGIALHAAHNTAPHASPEALRALSFLFTPAHQPPVWWTTHPEPDPLPMLTGWAGGPHASAFAGRSADDLGQAACTTLAEVLGLPAADLRAALLSTHFHDWSSDPFARGAYSYIPVGALDAPCAMAEPAAGTLFFAGEHTDDSGHWSTVHAALRSGLRAAGQVLGDHGTVSARPVPHSTAKAMLFPKGHNRP